MRGAGSQTGPTSHPLSRPRRPDHSVEPELRTIRGRRRRRERTACPALRIGLVVARDDESLVAGIHPEEAVLEPLHHLPASSVVGEPRSSVPWVAPTFQTSARTPKSPCTASRIQRSSGSPVSATVRQSKVGRLPSSEPGGFEVAVLIDGGRAADRQQHVVRSPHQRVE